MRNFWLCEQYVVHDFLDDPLSKRKKALCVLFYSKFTTCRIIEMKPNFLSEIKLPNFEIKKQESI